VEAPLMQPGHDMLSIYPVLYIIRHRAGSIHLHGRLEAPAVCTMLSACTRLCNGQAVTYGPGAFYSEHYDNKVRGCC
jgi:hypothetical protein